jgi:transcriptional regulator with XRE-family HTH domain
MTDELVKLVGRRIKELRKARSWRQEDLACKLKGVVTRSALSGYENGRYPPSLQVIEQLARALKVQPWELLK